LQCTFRASHACESRRVHFCEHRGTFGIAAAIARRDAAFHNYRKSPTHQERPMDYDVTDTAPEHKAGFAAGRDGVDELRSRAERRRALR
jgi:hypothetical protein